MSPGPRCAGKTGGACSSTPALGRHDPTGFADWLAVAPCHPVRSDPIPSRPTVLGELAAHAMRTRPQDAETGTWHAQARRTVTAMLVAPAVELTTRVAAPGADTTEPPLTVTGSRWNSHGGRRDHRLRAGRETAAARTPESSSTSG